ncbi:hypothetical protein [Ureibacillus chungkukjangi]|uniref:DUF3899 domain-containing protein n=1 Tax=Ureibacillus chungkukjangi TaxID=1202712 RepID=A0A318TVR8_9BACL|nr:hypothetical protein [Ureibacillus chungkukjangi]PYF08926.1 hypothetical protein BJ095_101147 [Ureibacillus chungkukjangi]
MRKRYFLIMTAAFIIELFITYLVALLFSVRIIEVMFFTGVVLSVIILFFTSSGGIISNMSSAEISARTGIMQKNEPFIFKRGPIFMASILLLIIGLVLFILLIQGVIPPA